MDFQQAIGKVLEGHKVTRKEWQYKNGMEFLFVFFNTTTKIQKVLDKNGVCFFEEYVLDKEDFLADNWEILNADKKATEQ